MPEDEGESATPGGRTVGKEDEGAKFRLRASGGGDLHVEGTMVTGQRGHLIRPADRTRRSNDKAVGSPCFVPEE